LYIDLPTHAGIALDNPVTLTFDLLTSESMHAEHLPRSIRCLPTLVSIAQAVFLLHHRQTRLKTEPTPSGDFVTVYVGGPTDNLNATDRAVVRPAAADTHTGQRSASSPAVPVHRQAID